MSTTGPRAFLARAATLHARGLTLVEVAAALGIEKSEVANLRLREREQWDFIYDAVMHRTAMRCALLVGTEEARRNAAAFLRDAERAEVWAQDWMGESFTSRGGDTLTRYYIDHYQPAFLSMQHVEVLGKRVAWLRRWRLLMGDPLLSEITHAMLADFHAALLQVVAAGTAHNTLRFITTVYETSQGPA